MTIKAGRSRMRDQPPVQLSSRGEDTIGEIRVKVRLTNVFDAELAFQGQLAEKDIRSYDAVGVVDTGAVTSVIPVHVVEQLGVRIREHRVAQYADGRNDMVGLTVPIQFEVMGRNTSDEAFVLGNEVLIGQTVLEKLDLVADCRGQQLLPNPEHPDQPVLKIR